MSKPAESKTAVSAAQGYDRGEPKAVGILATTAGIILILLISAYGVEFYYNQFKDRVVERVQLEPVAQDLIDLRKSEDQRLNSYGIADKATGAVRIPVSRAMDLIVAEAKDGKMKYPTAPYEVKKVEDAAAAAPAAAPGTPAQPAAPAKPAH